MNKTADDFNNWVSFHLNLIFPLNKYVYTVGTSGALQAFQSSDICKFFSISPHFYYAL